MSEHLPKRIQLSRKRGWKKPAGAVVVSRPSKWGNPFRVGPGWAAGVCVKCFWNWLKRTIPGQKLAEEAKRELRGKDLCCWCPMGQPCHADVLIEIANQREPI